MALAKKSSICSKEMKKISNKMFAEKVSLKKNKQLPSEQSMSLL